MVSEWNVSSFRLLNNLGKEHAFLSSIFVFITSYSLHLMAAAVLVFLFVPRVRNPLMIGCAALTVLIAELIRIPVGMLHSNLQPFAELDGVNQLIEKTVGNSFPSDHTIVFVSFCVTFALFQKRFAWSWITLAVLVAVSRVWVGVHYPADVIVGGLIAAVSAWVVYRVVPKLAFKNFPAKGPAEQ